MFKLPYKTLRDNEFLSAMQKLTTCAAYKNVKVSYNIMRMGKALELKLRDSQKEWIELADPLVKRDERGNFASDGKAFLWKEGVDPVDAEKKILAFLDKEVIVDRLKLSLDDIEPAKLSPAELGAVEALVTEISAVH